jgi:hypothetical protein
MLNLYHDKGYEVIVLTGRWNTDLRGLEVSADDITTFLGIPLCSEVCVCPLPDPGGGPCLVEEECEEVCVPADSIIDLSNILPFATFDLMQWLTDLWLDYNNLYADRVYLSPNFIFPPLEIRDFKVQIMNELIAEGYDLVHSYGDSWEDFDASTTVGIPVNGTFSTRRVLTESDCLGFNYLYCIQDGLEQHTASFVSGLPQICSP